MSENNPSVRTSTPVTRRQMDMDLGSPIHSTSTTTTTRRSVVVKQNTSDYESFESRKAYLDSINLNEHPAYRLYKEAGDYPNVYPKTDYTYSRKSVDRREIAPGVIIPPNLSRPPLRNRSKSPTSRVNRSYSFSRFFRSTEEKVNGQNGYDRLDSSKRYTIEESVFEKIVRVTRISIVYTFIVTSLLRVYSFVRREDNNLRSRRFVAEETYQNRLFNFVKRSTLTVAAYIYLAFAHLLHLNSVIVRQNDARSKTTKIAVLIIVPLLLLGGVYTYEKYGGHVTFNRQWRHYIPSYPSLPSLTVLKSHLADVNVKIIAFFHTVSNGLTLIGLQTKDGILYGFDSIISAIVSLSNQILTHSHSVWNYLKTAGYNLVTPLGSIATVVSNHTTNFSQNIWAHVQTPTNYVSKHVVFIVEYIWEVIRNILTYIASVPSTFSLPNFSFPSFNVSKFIRHALDVIAHYSSLIFEAIYSGVKNTGDYSTAYLQMTGQYLANITSNVLVSVKNNTLTAYKSVKSFY